MVDESSNQNLDLLDAPISKLLLKIALPISIGMLFQTMYNVVDTFYAGQLSTAAQAALAVSFPAFFLVLAFAIGVGQGTTVVMAYALGKSDSKQASEFVFQAFSIGLIMSVILTGLGLAAVDSILELLRVTDQYWQLTKDYVTTMIAGSVAFVFLNIAYGILSSLGITLPIFKVLVVSFFTNLILDPLLMHGLLSFPGLGISGLALSTIIAQTGGAIYLLFEVRKTKLWQHPKLELFKPRIKLCKLILRQSIPATIDMLTIGGGTFVIIHFVSAFGSDSVAAYGIAIRIEQVFLLPIIGLNTAVLAIVGQNNGARQYERVKQAWITAISIGGALNVVGGGILYLFSDHILGPFSKNLVVLEISEQYLALVAFTLPAYAVLLITISFLQGLKFPVLCNSIGILRQVVGPIFLIPLLVAADLEFGLNGIWYGVFSLTWLSAFVAIGSGRYLLLQTSKS